MSGKGPDQVVHADKLKKWRVWDGDETNGQTDGAAGMGRDADLDDGRVPLIRPRRPIKRPVVHRTS